MEAPRPSLDSFVGTTKPALSSFAPTSTPIAPVAHPAVFGNPAADIQAAGDQVNSAISGEGQYQGKNAVERGVAAASAAASAIPNVAADVIPGGKALLTAAGNASGGFIGFLGSLLGGTKQAQDFVTQHPAAAKALESGANIAAGIGNVSSTILGAQSVASAGNAAVNAAGTLKGAGYIADALAPEPPPAAPTPDYADPKLLKIQDLIAPKPTAANVRLALAEGRIAPGQEPGLLRDGTPDQILPPSRGVQASKTIASQIPGADEMSQPELYGALDQKIGQIATKLQPEMQAVPITDVVLGKIQDAWDALKQRQLDDPYTSTSANLDKLQAQFEAKFLRPIVNKRFTAELDASLGTQPDLPTMNDLWDTAKAYDASVPPNVKNANVNSTDALQTQKAVWLQNRAILRNAINDVSTGLGDTSQTAFKQMSDMYNAQKGIQSSYKLPKEGTPSGIKEFMNKPAVRAVKTVAKVGIGVEGAKKLLTGEF